MTHNHLSVNYVFTSQSQKLGVNCELLFRVMDMKDFIQYIQYN